MNMSDNDTFVNTDEASLEDTRSKENGNSQRDSETIEGLDEDEMLKLNTVFTMIDKNKSGYIEEEEFDQFIRYIIFLARKFKEDKFALLWGEAQLCLPYVCL